MKIDDAFRGVRSVLLDTAPVIYHLEKNPLFDTVMARFFQIRAAQQISLVTSPVTLAECLTLPIRQGRKDLEAAYEGLITTGQDTTFWTVGAEEGMTAARIRAKYGLKLADAIQAAVAMQAKCDVLLSNDADLKKVTEVRILLVSELEL